MTDLLWKHTFLYLVQCDMKLLHHVLIWDTFIWIHCASKRFNPRSFKWSGKQTYSASSHKMHRLYKHLGSVQNLLSKLGSVSHLLSKVISGKRVCSQRKEPIALGLVNTLINLMKPITPMQSNIKPELIDQRVVVGASIAPLASLGMGPWGCLIEEAVLMGTVGMGHDVRYWVVHWFEGVL